MADILNLALPYFGLIFIGFACGKTRGLPESGLAWMNFILPYVSLPALLFGIMSQTPFAELNNPPLLIAATLGTVSAFVIARADGWFFRRGAASSKHKISKTTPCKVDKTPLCKHFCCVLAAFGQ